MPLEGQDCGTNSASGVSKVLHGEHGQEPEQLRALWQTKVGGKAAGQIPGQQLEDPDLQQQLQEEEEQKRQGRPDITKRDDRPAQQRQ